LVVSVSCTPFPCAHARCMARCASPVSGEANPGSPVDGPRPPGRAMRNPGERAKAHDPRGFRVAQPGL
jgi:hypothetical protein